MPTTAGDGRGNGAVDAEAAAGEGAVVTRTVRWSGTAPVATERVEGDTVRITVDCQDRSSRDDRCEVHLEVAVPPVAAVDAELGAGDVTVEGLPGDRAHRVDARTQAGDVEIAVQRDPASDATVHARSSAGDVTVENR